MAKKDKTSKQEEDGENKDESRPDYEELASKVTVISKPLASRKLTKKVYKVVKKGRVKSDGCLYLFTGLFVDFSV